MPDPRGRLMLRPTSKHFYCCAALSCLRRPGSIAAGFSICGGGESEVKKVRRKRGATHARAATLSPTGASILYAALRGHPRRA